MYINRALLLVFGIIILFFPAIEDWILGSQTAWYRPYLPWLLIIVAVYWNQHTRHPDEL